MGEEELETPETEEPEVAEEAGAEEEADTDGESQE